jgi:hypothetical protein
MKPRAGRRRLVPAVLTALLVLAVWPVSTGGAGSATTRAQTLRIVFTGKGGGRYLDHTRWLREDTRLCYARRIADETLSVRWQIVWTASLVRSSTGYSLTSPTKREGAIDGSVEGTSVRDSCDSADVDPGWNGSTACRTGLDTGGDGGLAARATHSGLSMRFRGPVFTSPGSPCELDIRNDQLVTAAVLPPDTLARLAAGKRVSIAVGTRHPAPGVDYEATRSCSLFPHIYDGVVYLYECDDTLIWSGGLTISPA